VHVIILWSIEYLKNPKCINKLTYRRESGNLNSLPVPLIGHKIKRLSIIPNFPQRSTPTSGDTNWLFGNKYKIWQTEKVETEKGERKKMEGKSRKKRKREIKKNIPFSPKNKFICWGQLGQGNNNKNNFSSSGQKIQYHYPELIFSLCKELLQTESDDLHES